LIKAKRFDNELKVFNTLDITLIIFYS